MPKTRRVSIGLIQMSMYADPKKNLEKAQRLVREAAKKGAQIICLPELYRSLYFPQDENKDVSALAEPADGESARIFSALAKELRAVIIVPIFEKSGKKTFNSTLVFDTDGGLAGTYRKMHIPHDPLFYEQNYFSKADGGFKVFTTKYGRIAPFICFDQWFPEAARIAALQGTDIIFYPTAIGWIVGEKARDDWHDAWETVMRGHAIANGIHVAAVNRVGTEGKLAFWGGSFVCDAFGKILTKGGDKEEVLVAQVDLGDNERIREGWGFLRNRRPDAYGKLTQRL